MEDYQSHLYMRGLCRDCLWFFTEDSAIDGIGGCHRYAPYRIEDYDRGAWPMVEERWRCGEFR